MGLVRASVENLGQGSNRDMKKSLNATGRSFYIYDSFGGGVRLSEAVYLRLDEVVRLAHRIVSTCHLPPRLPCVRDAPQATGRKPRFLETRCSDCP